MLNGSYIKERARKTFGENSKKIDKMVKPLASGQLSLKRKLEQWSQILEKEQYEQQEGELMKNLQATTKLYKYSNILI